MAKKTVRDNDYYLNRLEREHPVVFGDFQAGKYKTVEQALFDAKIKVKRTRLQELMNAWSKATTAEQHAFRHAIGCATPVAASSTPPVPPVPFSVGRLLQPAAIASVQAIMARRAIKMGDLMNELGRKRLNASVGMALSQGSMLKQDLIDDLEAWVAKHVAP